MESVLWVDITQPTQRTHPASYPPTHSSCQVKMWALTRNLWIISERSGHFNSGRQSNRKNVKRLLKKTHWKHTFKRAKIWPSWKIGTRIFQQCLKIEQKMCVKMILDCQNLAQKKSLRGYFLTVVDNLRCKYLPRSNVRVRTFQQCLTLYQNKRKTLTLESQFWLRWQLSARNFQQRPTIHQEKHKKITFDFENLAQVKSPLADFSTVTDSRAKKKKK